MAMTIDQIKKIYAEYFAPGKKTRLTPQLIKKILDLHQNEKIGAQLIIRRILKDNKIKFDTSVVGRVLRIGKENKLIKPIPPTELAANIANRGPLYKDPGASYLKIMPVNKYNFAPYVRAGDKGAFPGAKFKINFKSQRESSLLPKNIQGLQFYKTKEAAEKALKIKLNFDPKAIRDKPFVDAVKAIHKIALGNPDDIHNVKNLTKLIYGKDNLKNLTHLSTDLVRYQEFLLGFRPIAGLTIPVGEKFDEILSEFPSQNQWGRFAAEDIRKSKLRIRDQLLKTKGPKLAELREGIKKLVKGGGMHVDEAMGISATYARAPGYTELGQIIPKEANIQKNLRIDKPFGKLLERVVEGETGSLINKDIKDFNKISRDFQKKWKVDTALIDYKPGERLDPSKFIKHFDKLSPEATVNVTELAEKGIGLRSRAMPMEALLASFNTSSNPEKVKTAVRLGCLAAAEGGRIGYALGSGTINCVNQKLTNEPVQSSMKLKATEGIGKVRGAATNFLKLLGRGGVKAAPYAALAAAGAVAEPLVKQFRNDDPSTYLSNPEQQKGMLLSMLEQETPKVDEEILKWQYPGQIAGAAAAVPGSKAVYRARKLPFKERAAMGPVRAALGPVGKVLAGSFSPLGVAASLPIGIAAQRAGGTEYKDIATDPLNWVGPAFASAGSEMATKGIRNPLLLKALRLGMSPGALRIGSRFLGLPGLALTAGMWGYDKWKNRE